MKLERDLHELTDIWLVVDDEHLRYPVVICHGVPASSLRVASFAQRP
jgi:hypothetical protein